MKVALLSLSLVGLMAMFAGSAPHAFATPSACPATPTCTAGGTTFTPENVVEISGASGLTAIAQFDTSSQSNATIAAEVEAYLADLGVTGVTYLGRAPGGTGNGGPAGTSIAVTGSMSGTWTFNPGTTGDTASFVAIHAGGGQTDTLYEFNTQSSLTGSWNTAGNGNATLSNFDLFSGTGVVIVGGGSGAVPEPGTLAVLGTGLAALAMYRRRQAL